MAGGMTKRTPCGRQPYRGNDQYLGAGVRKSCGKCGEHKTPGGGWMHHLFGWCCEACK
jgi:hypothetical protein